MKIKYLKGRSCNCVLYLRSLGYKFPYGLFTLSQKKRIINTQIPKRGAIAIIAEGKYGHVGVVKGVSGSTIKILEANYKACRITYRWGTKRELKILGYYLKKTPKPVQKPLTRAELIAKLKAFRLANRWLRKRLKNK
jgi:hypothetical protein